MINKRNAKFLFVTYFTLQLLIPVNTYADISTHGCIYPMPAPGDTLIRETTINMGEFTITAYCPCCDCSEEWGTKIAYTEDNHTYAKSNHTVAVDPDIIPYGTKLKIEGFGDTVFVAEDCGGMINGDHIDVYMGNHSDTEDYGKQARKVYIVKDS
jgi:3D (Asp-Asp-Asp) domain-containing protein